MPSIHREREGLGLGEGCPWPTIHLMRGLRYAFKHMYIQYSTADLY